MATGSSETGNERTPHGFLVVDLEATCWDRPEDRQSEIIEIGAVAVDALGYPMDEFQSFVRPILHPQLSEFCTQLTGIRQVDVDRARLFPEVLADLERWFEALGPLVFCSWGNYDRRQLRQDCELNGVPYPFSDEHINLKIACSRILSRRRGMGMAKALRVLGIELEGQHHRAIDDARNIARILQRMLQAAPDPANWNT
jgi:inhibitor of KinA sporulation pathway (predicted exonuclease)